jgi:hypothetical protein
MNKKYQAPAPSNRTVRDDVRATVFVLEILYTAVTSIRKQQSARLGELAGQVGEAAARLRAFDPAATSSDELVNSIHRGIKLAREALIELEPRAERDPISVFIYRVRSAVANSILFILRRPTADPLGAVRTALGGLDRMLAHVHALTSQNSGKTSTLLSTTDLSEATDPLLEQGLEVEQTPQSIIAPYFE